MGMFDYIMCKYPLPDPEMQDHLFQTRDLENNMNRYSITSEGRLIMFPWIMDKNKNQFIYSMENPQIIDFDGDLVFYSFIPDGNDGHGWYDYVARFAKGKLKCIERI